MENNKKPTQNDRKVIQTELALKSARKSDQTVEEVGPVAQAIARLQRHVYLSKHKHREQARRNYAYRVV